MWKYYDTKISSTAKKKTEKAIKMELNTAGQKEHALSMEILWLPALMNIKCQANV